MRVFCCQARVGALSLFAFYGVGHCLGEIGQGRDALSDLLCAEARIGNDLHESDAVNKMRVEWGNRNDLSRSVGSLLGEFHTLVELGAPDRNSKLSVMPPLLEAASNVGAEKAGTRADNSAKSDTTKADDRDKDGDLARSKFLEDLIHALLSGIAVGCVFAVLIGGTIGFVAAKYPNL